MDDVWTLAKPRMCRHMRPCSIRIGASTKWAAKLGFRVEEVSKEVERWRTLEGEIIAYILCSFSLNVTQSAKAYNSLIRPVETSSLFQSYIYE